MTVSNGHYLVTLFFEEFLEEDATAAGAAIGAQHAEAFRVLDLS